MTERTAVINWDKVMYICKFGTPNEVIDQYRLYDARYIFLKLKRKYCCLTKDEDDEQLLADDVITQTKDYYIRARDLLENDPKKDTC